MLRRTTAAGCVPCAVAVCLPARLYMRVRSDIGPVDEVLQGALPVRRWAERRAVVLSVALLLFAVVFALRQTNPDPSPAIALLYVIPVALVAIELGLIAGLIAACSSMVLLGIFALGASPNLEALGVFTRAVTFFAVGGIAGRFSDRMREAQRRQQVLLESGLALSQLTAAEELSTRLAEDARRLIVPSTARVELDEDATLDDQRRNGNVVIPIQTRGVRYGTLAVAPGRPMHAEDRSTLAILALQAAIAAENRRLLEVERERALIRAELHEARVDLAERGHQLREVMNRQEAERDHVSHELREQAAQTLAAMLMGLRSLERNLDTELAAPTLDAMQSDIDSTLRSLRTLAATLRPPTLQLGLRAALEALAEHARERGWEAIDIIVQEPLGLDSDMETMAYRVVEEASDAVGGPRSVVVRTDPSARELVILVDAASETIDPERLTVLRARLELVRGTLTTDGSELRVAIPIGPES